MLRINLEAEKWVEDEGRKFIRQYKSDTLSSDLNTYPKPYRKYNKKATDQSGFPICKSKSYCAWKIREETGEWPKGPTKESFRNFLADAGYSTVVLTPKKKHRYIGINVKKPNFVVWFEKIVHETKAQVSSYIEGHHATWIIEPEEFFWVQIS